MDKEIDGVMLVCGIDDGRLPSRFEETNEHGVCVGCDRKICWRPIDPVANPHLVTATKVCMYCARAMSQREDVEAEDGGIAEGAMEDWLALGHTEAEFHQAMKLCKTFMKAK